MDKQDRDQDEAPGFAGRRMPRGQENEAISRELAGEAIRLFGQRLEQERRAQGASRADLFERTGVSHAHISLVERGRANPTIDTMIKLADGVGKETWELISPP